MNRMLVALSAVCVPMLCVAGPPSIGPVDVNVTNPVLPVEISNADPVPVLITGPGHDYRALISPDPVVVLAGPLAASRRLQIGTVVVANGLPDPGTESVQIQARRWVGGQCVGTPTIYDSLIPMPVKGGDVVSVSYPVPLEFPGNAPDGEWCLVAVGSTLYLHVSVVAR